MVAGYLVTLRIWRSIQIGHRGCDYADAGGSCHARFVLDWFQPRFLAEVSPAAAWVGAPCVISCSAAACAARSALSAPKMARIVK